MYLDKMFNYKVVFFTTIVCHLNQDLFFFFLLNCNFQECKVFLREELYAMKWIHLYSTRGIKFKFLQPSTTYLP